MFKTLLLVNFRGVKRVLIFDFMIFQKLGEFTRFSPGFHQIFKVHRIFAKEKFGEFIRFSSDFQILSNFYQKKLDDGWPESVEEQSLLLLV